MSEYWKSTPRYWCKHCSVYVRDTKLERTNHEATGRHQGAIKRSLRDLHRSHEQEERDKERARREVERLNGVVSGGSSSSRAPGAPRSGPSSNSASSSQRIPTESQRQQQLEQLSALGVEIPTEYRPNMALAGDWTVTATRVVRDTNEDDKDADSKLDQKAKGIHKRENEATEEQKEEEEAIQSLFKKRKIWGGPKVMPEADAELDALLSGGLVPKKEEPEPVTKPEVAQDAIKKEASPLVDDAEQAQAAQIKTDPEEEPTKAIADLPEAGGDTAAAPAVVFRKRKPKNVRQK